MARRAYLYKSSGVALVDEVTKRRVERPVYSTGRIVRTKQYRDPWPCRDCLATMPPDPAVHSCRLTAQNRGAGFADEPPP